jgi:hypothetical protein
MAAPKTALNHNHASTARNFGNTAQGLLKVKLTETGRSASAIRPLLIRPDEVLSLKRAAHHAGRSEAAVRRLCREFGIARQLGASGRIEVSAPGLEMVLHNDLEALEHLRQGEREHPSVRRYLDHLGLPS